MTEEIKDEAFGDIEEEDAYSEGDIALEDIDWKKVEKLQRIIDDLPEDPDELKSAVYKLQDKLSGDK